MPGQDLWWEEAMDMAAQAAARLEQRNFRLDEFARRIYGDGIVEVKSKDSVPTPKPKEETFVCHACAGAYKLSHLGLEAQVGLPDGRKAKICVMCATRLLTCPACKGQINKDVWNFRKTAQQQCPDCGSASHLTVKQTSSFVPSNKILAMRRGMLWNQISY